jgi:hypothetical protein
MNCVGTKGGRGSYLSWVVPERCLQHCCPRHGLHLRWVEQIEQQITGSRCSSVLIYGTWAGPRSLIWPRHRSKRHGEHHFRDPEEDEDLHQAVGWMVWSMSTHGRLGGVGWLNAARHTFTAPLSRRPTENWNGDFLRTLITPDSTLPFRWFSLFPIRSPPLDKVVYIHHRAVNPRPQSTSARAHWGRYEMGSDYRVGRPNARRRERSGDTRVLTNGGQTTTGRPVWLWRRRRRRQRSGDNIV